MMEVGPWRWDGKSDHDFYVKEGGWEEYTTMVFGMSSMNFLSWRPPNPNINAVDQPAGTGFSYTSTDSYVKTVATVGPSLRPYP